MKDEFLDATARATPALGGGLLTYLTLNEWVAIFTLAYLIIQIFCLIHKHYYFVKEHNGK